MPQPRRLRGSGAEVDRVAPHASPNMLREETPWLARLRPPPPPPRLGAPPRLLGRLDMRDSRARRAAAMRRASSSKFLWSFSISCASTVSRWEGSRSGGVRRRGKQRGAGGARLAEWLSADVLGLLLVEESRLLLGECRLHRLRPRRERGAWGGIAGRPRCTRHGLPWAAWSGGGGGGAGRAHAVSAPGARGRSARASTL